MSSNFSGLTGALSCDGFCDCAQGIQVAYRHTDSDMIDPGKVSVARRVEP